MRVVCYPFDMYPLSQELVDFLLTERAGRELASFSLDDCLPDNALTVISRLRKSYTHVQAAALLDQAQLRHRAKSKFTHASRMFFTDEALQQATGFETAQYHASIFEQLNQEAPLADLGCGIGGDTLAFAVHRNVIAVEKDPIRCRLAKINIRACGLAQKVDFRCADWTVLSLPVQSAFIDPARRISTASGNRKRVFHLNEMKPSLSDILKLQGQIKNVAVKVASGVNDNEIPLAAEVSFISVRGQMKEALLRFGDMRTGVRRSAVLLPGMHIIDSSFPSEPSPGREPGAYLFEPDSAVIRAGLVQNLAKYIGTAQLDPQIAYLTGDDLVESPYVRVWRVVKNGPFLLKQLNRWLRELGAGRVVIKKRGSPIDIDRFHRQLRIAKTGPEFTIFLTRVRDKPWMIVGKKC